MFVCDHADKYVLAAGKRTLYIAEIDTNKIVREVAIDDDITGKMISFTSELRFDTCHNMSCHFDSFVFEILIYLLKDCSATLTQHYYQQKTRYILLI